MDDGLGTITSRHYSRPGLRSNTNQADPAETFQECLNEVHPRIKFTREEEQDKKIAFLDVLVNRHDDGTLTTQIYRKPTNTNVIIKPHSCHDPSIHTATFKGEICRAKRLCTSPAQVKKEIVYILDVFEDNGHDRGKLQRIADEYKTPEAGGLRSCHFFHRLITKLSLLSFPSLTEVTVPSLLYMFFGLKSVLWQYFSCYFKSAE